MPGFDVFPGGAAASADFPAPGPPPEPFPSELTAGPALPADGLLAGEGFLAADGGLPDGGLPDVGALPGDEDAPSAATAAPDEHELRPERRLRFLEAVPIGAIAVLGSLMFAFPLAFGDGGAVVSMLGLLLCACSAGWVLMVARRIGYVWPGMPERGSGRRPDWRYVAAYAALSVLVGALAIWRVARLR